MKTTIELSDALAKKAKQLAAKRGVTFRAIIEEGVREVLRGPRSSDEFKLRDAAVGGNGLQAEFKDRAWADIRDAAYKGRGD